MDQPIKRSLFSVLAIVFLLTACAPAPAATQDPAALQQLIEQSVEKAFATQNAQASQQALMGGLQSTQTATQAVAIVPTDTVLPTATESAFEAGEAPTHTPRPTLTATKKIESPVPTLPRYSCDVHINTPANQAIIPAGESFNIEWVIVNTGSATWPAGFDVAYSGGFRLTSVTSRQIDVEMRPNDRFTIELRGRAPSNPGVYYMTWLVRGGGCTAYVSIQVPE